MALSINSNDASLVAQNNLRVATKKLEKTFERLSSGMRIVRASDDPAGLAIADSLQADSRVATQAVRNANDGISLIAVADGALAEIGNILLRMSELAEQAATGTLTNTQRSPLQAEFAALGSEIYRIANVTEFNDRNLLTGTSDVDIQVGLDGSANSRITISGVLGTLASLGLNATDTAALNYQLNGATSVIAQGNAQTALYAVQSAVDILAATRGILGAAESRLSVAVNNLENLRTNLNAAESQIRDVDVAEEAANLVRLQIVQQAAASVLAQANQQPNMVLTLLS